MSTDRTDPSLGYTLPFQLTKKIHRKVPDVLSPEREENLQRGKIVVITGGGTGIGAVRLGHRLKTNRKLMCDKAIARVWVRAEAAGVVIAGRRKEKLDETVRSTEELNRGATKVLAIQTDLFVEEQVRELFQDVNEAFGRPADVVIGNAGMSIDALNRVAEESVSTWWKVMVSESTPMKASSVS